MLQGNNLLKYSTPKASALWTYYYQDAYTETSSQGVERRVDAYERNSLLSRLGAAVSWQKELKRMTLKPEARLYWLHEFNADEDQIDYELANGMGGEYHFLMAAPEADVLEAGLGISCILNDELQFVFDVDGRFGEDYSAYAPSGHDVVEFQKKERYLLQFLEIFPEIGISTVMGRMQIRLVSYYFYILQETVSFC